MSAKGSDNSASNVPAAFRLRRSGDARVQVSMPSRRRTPEPAVAPQGDTMAASGPITFTTEDGRELRLVPAAR